MYVCDCERMILYVNSCPRNDSRTDRLAKAVLSGLGDYSEVRLDSLGLNPLDNVRLEKRNSLIAEKNYDDNMFLLSKQFASADIIVVSAPYWDGSFPSVLKMYIENIFVMGIVSEYDENGVPHGLCKAEKLYYVTTAGGPYNPDYGYKYIEFLCKNMFGIEETQLVLAEYMDVIGNDPEDILRKSIESYYSCN